MNGYPNETSQLINQSVNQNNKPCKPNEEFSEIEDMAQKAFEFINLMMHFPNKDNQTQIVQDQNTNASDKQILIKENTTKVDNNSKLITKVNENNVVDYNKNISRVDKSSSLFNLSTNKVTKVPNFLDLNGTGENKNLKTKTTVHKISRNKIKEINNNGTPIVEKNRAELDQFNHKRFISDPNTSNRDLQELKNEVQRLQKRVVELESSTCSFCGSQLILNSPVSTSTSTSSSSLNSCLINNKTNNLNIKISEINNKFSNISKSSSLNNENCLANNIKLKTSEPDIKSKLKTSKSCHTKLENIKENQLCHQNGNHTNSDKVNGKIDQNYIKEFDKILNILNHNLVSTKRKLVNINTTHFNDHKTSEIPTSSSSRYLSVSPTNSHHTEDLSSNGTPLFIHRSRSVAISPKLNFRTTALGPKQVFTAPVVTDLSSILNKNYIFKSIVERKHFDKNVDKKDTSNENKSKINTDCMKISSPSSQLSPTPSSASSSSSSLSFDEATYDGTLGEITSFNNFSN